MSSFHDHRLTRSAILQEKKPDMGFRRKSNPEHIFYENRLVPGYYSCLPHWAHQGIFLSRNNKEKMLFQRTIGIAPQNLSIFSHPTPGAANLYTSLATDYDESAYYTGIYDIANDASHSVADDPYYYTLDGMRHTTPVPGINIHRGKKILVK